MYITNIALTQVRNCSTIHCY